ncbi:ras-related GTP binding D [Gorgonomyces haynaldii]|nr:ras-related GTP binding D [Gorgonomyces haynaldii]
MTSKQILLLMGLPRSGKSSIHSVVFQKMAPNETLFLESTRNTSKSIPFLDFMIMDHPGTGDLDLEIIQKCGALVFVLDAQDDYIDSLGRLLALITQINKVKPGLSIEVFIHKVDGLSDDHKIEIRREIHTRLMDEMEDAHLEHIRLSFHLTSIYDHSIFEAFSKVVQKLIAYLPTLENLLNMLCSNTGIEKVFLFETQSRIYIATDSSPVDMQSYELCSDTIDVALDISSVYQGDEQTNDARAIIGLSNGMVIYSRHVSSNLALVSMLRQESFEKQGLVEFNVGKISQAVMEVVQQTH